MNALYAKSTADALEQSLAEQLWVDLSMRPQESRVLAHTIKQRASRKGWVSQLLLELRVDSGARKQVELHHFLKIFHAVGLKN